MGTISTEQTIQETRHTDTEWTGSFSTYVLAEGEIAVTTDVFYSGTNCMKIKMGDGSTDWSSLDYYPIGSGGGSGTVTSVTSSNSDLSIATTTTTPVITVNSAPKLTTARTINGVSFDGTTNITVSSLPAWANVIQYNNFN